jgi:hypothetical protein
MELVVPQHIGMNRHRAFGRVLQQQSQQALAISVTRDSGQAAVAALYHVVRVAGDAEVGQAGTGCKVDAGFGS